MADDRPIQTPMPAHMHVIVDAALPELRAIFDKAFEAAMAETHDRRDPKAIENDALSILAQLAAEGGLQLLGRLMIQKKISAEAAWVPALVDIQTRMRDAIVAVAVARGADDAAGRAGCS